MSSSNDDNHPLLLESRNVLNQQTKIIRNQQQQATKIIRVALTIAGLLLTATSITVTVVTGNTISGSNDLTLQSYIGDFSATSAATGVFSFYIFTIFVGAFVIVFVSAFNVLSPESSSRGISVMESIFNLPFIGNFMEIYVKILPFSTEPFESIIRDDPVSLRPGMDGDKLKELSGDALNYSNTLDEIVKYNSGCIQK